MKWLLRYPMLIAAAIALLMIAGLSVVTLWSASSQQVPGADPRPVTLTHFRFIMGGGQLLQDSLQISQYTHGRAIISNQQQLTDISSYRYLSFNLSSAKPNEDLPLFFWRMADTGQLHTAPLEENMLDHLDLGRHRQWRGRISEYGFMFDVSDGQSWQLSELIFYPDTLAQALKSILSDWSELEVWAQHSVNYINGGAANARWFLGILVAGWVFISLMLYWLLLRITGQPLAGKRVAAILLLGWMLLDARWLYNLLQQMQVTSAVYAGKTLDQQYQSGLDADYHAYFQRLIDQVLPAEPQIMYVLDNDTDYYRAKVPWLLAPHNIYNLGRHPRVEFAAKGGYILLLDQIPGLSFDQLSGTLRWGSNEELPVTPVDQDPLGELYKLNGGK